MDLLEYYDMLQAHDWFFEMSDDFEVWREGNEERKDLISISKMSEDHLALYKGFFNHYYSGTPFGTEKAPKPERPEN